MNINNLLQQLLNLINRLSHGSGLRSYKSITYNLDEDILGPRQRQLSNARQNSGHDLSPQ